MTLLSTTNRYTYQKTLYKAMDNLDSNNTHYECKSNIHGNYGIILALLLSKIVSHIHTTINPPWLSYSTMTQMNTSDISHHKLAKKPILVHLVYRNIVYVAPVCMVILCSIFMDIIYFQYLSKYKQSFASYQSSIQHAEHIDKDILHLYQFKDAVSRQKHEKLKTGATTLTQSSL